MKGNLNVYITRTITDTKTGKIIKKFRKKQSRSFVKAFMQCLELAMAHVGAQQSTNVTIKDTSNADNLCSFGDDDAKQHFGVEAPANIDTYGIQVGIGTTAPTVSDYTIETLILQGAAASKLVYGATTVQSATVSGSNMEMVMTRAFVNSSGGTITVKEITLVCTWKVTAQYKHLLIRDAVNDAVNDGQTYMVTYTFTTTV